MRLEDEMIKSSERDLIRIKRDGHNYNTRVNSNVDDSQLIASQYVQEDSESLVQTQSEQE